MAINVSFNGATIYKPGAYSKSTIDLGGGLPIGPSGLIAVFGEADAGKPGANEVNIADNRYNASEIVSIRNKYRSGPILDAANFLFAPASDAAIPSGANTVWFYKTNASVRAQVSMDASGYTGHYDDMYVRAREYGTGGNRVSYKSVLSAETAATVTGAAFDEGALTAGGETFAVSVNGGAANTFTSIVCANNAALVAAIADAGNWSAGAPSGFSVTVGGTDGASTLTIALDADADAFELGYGRNLEISGLTSLLDFGLTAGLSVASVEPSCALTLYNARDLITEEDTSIGGNIVFLIGRDSTDTATAATVSVSDTQIILDKNGALEYAYNIDEYTTLKEVAEDINSKAGWSCSVADAAYYNLPLTVLDRVTDLPCFSAAGLKPGQIKKDAYEVADFFDTSALAEIGTSTAQQDPTIGLPPAVAEIYMSGGAKGATTTASITAALEAFEKFHVNSVIPLFSRDATADIVDGLTDSGSTYTIDGVNQAVKTHISMMKTTRRRSERQGYLSYKASMTDSFNYARGLADGRLQLAIQDVRAVDGLGNVKWFQPYALSCMLAGARAGSPIGTPLTFKNMNIAGLRHTAQAMTVADADIVVDFDPDLHVDAAIQAGVTFLEAPTTGGYRVVVDNTTYGKDNNFVWNRGNVIYAADTVAYNLRTNLEAIFVGQKNTVTATVVASAVEAQMSNFLGQGIIVASDDAPNGFKNLTVNITGNTITIGVVIKVVEGIDFVLTDIMIQRASSSL